MTTKELSEKLNASQKKEEIYRRLSAPFPAEAYSIDSSRGFDLTSIKAQYLIERLNEVLGICGWSLSGEHKIVDGQVLFFGRLEIEVDGEKHSHQAVGYSTAKKNLGDCYKGAQTDCLSKTTSYFGIGNSVFKGLIDPKKIKDGSYKREEESREAVKKKVLIEKVSYRVEQLCGGDDGKRKAIYAQLGVLTRDQLIDATDDKKAAWISYLDGLLKSNGSNGEE